MTTTTMTDCIRTVRFGRYTLKMYWLGRKVGYRLIWNGNDLFRGDDFGPSPLHSIDGDESVVALMGFLTVRPGDTDDDYFRDYTPLQRTWAESSEPEFLSYAVSYRFPNIE